MATPSFRSYGNLVTAPGETWTYSNLGYGVLDYIMSRVSGQSYADLMRTEVFLPLGLTRTSVDIGEGLEEFVATRYAPDGSRIPFYDFDQGGSKAIWERRMPIGLGILSGFACGSGAKR